MTTNPTRIARLDDGSLVEFVCATDSDTDSRLFEFFTQDLQFLGMGVIHSVDDQLQDYPHRCCFWGEKNEQNH